MNKPGDFMHSARVYYFHGRNSTYKKLYPTSQWFTALYHNLDFRFEGGARCYQLTIPKYAQAYGIKKVKFYFFFETHREGDVFIYYHYPDQLLTNPDAKVKATKINEKWEYEIEHELHQVLELDGKYCTPDVLYSEDKCVLNWTPYSM